MHPKELKIEDFTYDLPQERIAYQPVNPRDSSKLLIYQNGKISDDIYRHLEHYLDENTTLIFNDTKVIKSRIFLQRKTGATIEIFCLEPHETFIDYSTHFLKTKSVVWKCLIGNVKKWKEQFLEKKLTIDGEEVVFKAEILEQLPDAYAVQFSWTPETKVFGEVLEAAGNTPLPPYIKRKVKKKDEETYQTVYSSHEGSVAAPTAGLHFSDQMLEGLKKKNVDRLFTTLHVGAGTFKPVKTEAMENHVMHNEWMNLDLDFLYQLKNQLTSKKRIISVGTTSTRTLESVYWMGNKICQNPDISHQELVVSQWEPYEEVQKTDPLKAVEELIKWIERKDETHLLIETGIIIAPGYSFQIIDGLITNFHQPQSTLLLLVAALIGGKWKEIYQYAMGHNFRFLSYGDGSLLLPR